MTGSVCVCAENCERRLPPLSSLCQPPPHAHVAGVAALMPRFPRTPDQYFTPAIRSPSSFHAWSLPGLSLTPPTTSNACMFATAVGAGGRLPWLEPSEGTKTVLGETRPRVTASAWIPGSSHQTAMFHRFTVKTLQEML